jgi:outer membrane immunogenic protein
MTCTLYANADGNRRRAAAASAGRPSLRVCAAVCWLLAAGPVDTAMAADWFDDSFLRGSLNGFTSKSPARWDGIIFGAQMGVSNLNSDFGNSASSQIAFILRNTTLENEQHPSGWTTLPSNTTNSKTFGGFIGYNVQWSELVVGFDMAYNRPSSLQSSASDSIARTVILSDGTTDGVTITAASAIKLVDYATLRARAGYAFGQFLPYAVVGAAVGRFNYTHSASVIVDQKPSGALSFTTFVLPPASDAKDGAISAGFVAGLGMDVALAPNVFLRGEWEYVGFGAVGGVRSNMNTGRVGLGLRF